MSERFLAGGASEILILYTRFKSAISQTATLDRLLPLQPQEGDGGITGSRDYVYEPGPSEILASLLPRYIETRIYHAMLESAASEHGARMTAMDNATRNASEMIDRLTLDMNRARQAGITKELMEIVGGAEALKG
jgi:F-type H+-transporting ATPase subunit gamma